MNFNFCNDQPGRLISVFIISPILFFKGVFYNDIFIFLGLIPYIIYKTK